MINIMCFIAGAVVGYLIKHHLTNKFLTQNITKTERYVIQKMIERKKHKNK